VTLAEYFIPAVPDEQLKERVRDVLGREAIAVERMTKKGPKTIDIRPGIRNIAEANDGSGLVALLGATPDMTVKPGEVIGLLFGEDMPDGVIRTEQYAEIEGRRVTPFDIKR